MASDSGKPDLLGLTPSRWAKFESVAAPALVRALSPRYRASCSPDSIGSVVHSVLVEALQGCWRIDPEDPFFGLLWVVERRVIDRIRKFHPIRATDLARDGGGTRDLAEPTDQGLSAEECAIMKEEADRVFSEFVAKLTEYERIILMDHYIDEKSYPTIIREQGWMKARLESSRKSLQRKMMAFRESHGDIEP